MSAKPTLLISGGWLALAIAAMLFPDLLDSDLGVFTSLAIVIAGKFAIYWVLAETMAGLAREGKGAAPAWYLTPLPNQAALTGTLLTALAVIAPPLAGLMAFLPLHSAAWLNAFYLYAPVGLEQFGCSAMSITETTLQFILRLALFALFAGVIQLSLRRMAYAPALPVLLASIATLMGFWQASSFDTLPVVTGLWAQPLAWTIASVLLGLLGLAVLLFVCKWCAEMESPGALFAIPLLSVIALPALFSLAAIECVLVKAFSPYGIQVSTYFDWTYSVGLQPLHALYSLFNPDASPISNYEDWESITKVFHDRGLRLHYYNTELPEYLAWIIFIIVMALSFVMLWIACLHCLEVARNPAKRLAPEARRKRN